MKRLNLFLSIYSLIVILVTIERFSFTTKILLQPYNFLRLHEIIQTALLLLASVIIPFLALKEITNNFEFLKKRWGIILGVFYIAGIYYYGAGEGVHEVASHLFNTFCDVKKFSGDLCGGLFVNDYYSGNILYFLGAAFMTIPLVLFECQNPNKKFTKKDLVIALANGVVLAFGFFAYAAFDRVLVGFVYVAFMSVVLNFLLFTAKTKFSFLPYTSYAAFAYTLAALASALVRFL